MLRDLPLKLLVEEFFIAPEAQRFFDSAAAVLSPLRSVGTPRMTSDLFL